MIGMKICDVASFAWDNAIEIEFGNRAIWEHNTFTEKWFAKNYPNVWEKGGASGLYWFLIKDKSINDLKQIVTPGNLPKKGTDINAIVTKNEELFKENLIKPDNNGFMVIYNGHEQNVFARIRSHFALNNDRTTAIGFGKYDISNYDLRVRIFYHKLPMDGLSEDDKLFVQILLKEKAGREAVESSWRAFNGWPVLCKR
jgi:hypothetical protein